jgi:hypothetical protein
MGGYLFLRLWDNTSKHYSLLELRVNSVGLYFEVADNSSLSLEMQSPLIQSIKLCVLGK